MTTDQAYGMSAPGSDWEPGVPLYPHPHVRDRDDGNYVRELFQLLDEDGLIVRRFRDDYWLLNTTEVRCIPCLVAWAPSAGPNCWMCGEPGANYAAASKYLDDEMRRNGVRLVGGPRDGEYLSMHLEGDQVVFPVEMPPRAFTTAPAEATVTYRRDHYDTVTHRWVYTYQEES